MKKKFTSLLLALAMCASCLSACAAPDEPERKPWRPPVTPTETTVDPGPAATPEKDPEPSAEEPSAKPEEPAPETEEPPVENTPAELDPASVQAVARLGDLVGNYAMDLHFSQIGEYVVVDTEDAHNPYDLTWRYGPEPAAYRIDSSGKRREVSKRVRINQVADPEWDALYRSYADACDWSLVFDAEYYKKAFPMLAKLYHEDDALLLEHFQTQGVHEGRQASAGFNVAAYMENCDTALVDAFGENYECYYFYYMLNQDTQRSVDTSNKNGTYPCWLTAELSLQQSYEYKAVNSYREKAGVGPVELDLETVALANYRAWHDAEHNLYAHDWTTNPAYSKDVDDVLWRLSRDHFAENTVKWYHKATCTGLEYFAPHYAGSEKHYKAMISEEYFYFGCSNPYWSDNPDNPFAENGKTGFACQFDMFTEVQPRSPYELN